MMDEKMWYELGKIIIQAGQFPTSVTEQFIELLQFLITEEQAEFLQSLECVNIQGHFYSHPLENKELIKKLQDKNSKKQ